MINNIASESPIAEMRRAECSGCGGIRNCDVRGRYDERGGDDFVDWCTRWYILQCRGCDYVFVQTVATFSEDYEHYYDEDGEAQTEYNETLRYWPAISHRKRPDWMMGAGVLADRGEALDAALLEVYGALDADLRTLAAVGIRTTFDVASSLLGIDEKLTFAAKLNALVEGGHIGKVDRSRLEGLIDAGNASAHRGWQPKFEDLDVMMEVLEHFVNDAIFAPRRRRALDERVAKLKRVVPTRRPRLPAAEPAEDHTQEVTEKSESKT